MTENEELKYQGNWLLEKKRDWLEIGCSCEWRPGRQAEGEAEGMRGAGKVIKKIKKSGSWFVVFFVEIVILSLVAERERLQGEDYSFVKNSTKE